MISRESEFHDKNAKVEGNWWKLPNDTNIGDEEEKWKQYFYLGTQFSTQQSDLFSLRFCAILDPQITDPTVLNIGCMCLVLILQDKRFAT